MATSAADDLFKFLGLSSSSSSSDEEEEATKSKEGEEGDEAKEGDAVVAAGGAAAAAAAAEVGSAAGATSKQMKSWPPVRDDETAERVKCNLNGGSALREGKVTVELDEETVASLPVMSLDEVRKYDGLQKPPSMAGLEGDGGSDATVVMVGSTPSASAPGGDAANAPLYATYEGIVYDVTSFAEHHPGGRELLRTAAAPGPEALLRELPCTRRPTRPRSDSPPGGGQAHARGAKRAEEPTTPEVHVEKRMKHLGRARRQTMLVACSRPSG